VCQTSSDFYLPQPAQSSKRCSSQSLAALPGSQAMGPPPASPPSFSIVGCLALCCESMPEDIRYRTLCRPHRLFSATFRLLSFYLHREGSGPYPQRQQRQRSVCTSKRWRVVPSCDCPLGPARWRAEMGRGCSGQWRPPYPRGPLIDTIVPSPLYCINHSIITIFELPSRNGSDRKCPTGLREAVPSIYMMLSSEAN